MGVTEKVKLLRLKTDHQCTKKCLLISLIRILRGILVARLLELREFLSRLMPSGIFQLIPFLRMKSQMGPMKKWRKAKNCVEQTERLKYLLYTLSESNIREENQKDIKTIKNAKIGLYLRSFL